MKLQESMVLKFFVLSSPYQKAEPLFTHLENFISNLSDNTIIRLPISRLEDITVADKHETIFIEYSNYKAEGM
jgi:hypothetical protein